MRQAGIWLDKRNAVIIQFDGDREIVSYFNSDIDEGNIKGGSRTSTPYSPQETVSETHVLEKRKHQLKKYFQNLISKVENTDQLLIMGPAETKKAMFTELNNMHESHIKKVFLENADSMTVPQIRAKVRSYFNKDDPFEQLKYL